MASAAWALQRAAYQALTGDAPLVGLLGGARVYDDVPPGAALPYVVLAPASDRDWSTGTDTGREVTLTVHVWSTARGHREVQEIMARLIVVLEGPAVVVDGFRLVNLRYDTSALRRDGDGETRQGTVRFRAVMEVD
jgi:hypothetical protein